VDKSLPPPLAGGLRPAPRAAYNASRSRLFLPGAFLVAVGAQLFAPFMFIYFAFTAFF
jgi:hypothetical protein